MRVAVTGGGAVGSLLASALALGGSEVSVVQRRHEGGASRQRLLRIDPDGSRAEAEVEVARSPDELAEPPELVAFAVKMFDLPAAVAAWVRWPDVPALTVQNGIGAEEIVAAARPQAALVAAALTSPVSIDGAGIVRRFRRGGIGLAAATGGREQLRDALVHACTAGGLRARAYDDAASMKWSKLLGNLVGNATGALADQDPAELYAHPRVLEIERRQLLEAAAVIRAQGHRLVSLPGAAIPWLARLASLPPIVSRPIWRRVVGGARGGKAPSLREHLRSGQSGPSEVEWLNGAVVNAGESTGIATPVNRALLELVTEAGANPELARTLARQPDRVADAVWERAGGG